MKELVQYMAEALVDEPDKVQVNIVEGENSIILELKVAPNDIGKVIGKSGRTAKAMRTILSAAATKLKKRSILEIVE
ncbi:KH domain-containing protein [Candidatus Sumerlaeota bacterium]|nr:KH domain-containing protein [Candidatus Sumerlaeota bacterium]